VSATDTRYITFSSILGNAPSPFNDFLSLYSEMRLRSLAVTVIPLRLSSSYTGSYTSLLVTVSPEVVSASNPTNTVITGSPSAFTFDIGAVSPKTFRFTFPGVGTTSQIWISTSTTPSGALYIGNTQGDHFTDEGVIVWEMHFMMNVDFRRLKTN
jgi:hypothetical protein